MKLNKTTLPVNQKGAVLIVSLIILLVMTLIGVTAMQTTTMEEKMAGNMRDQNMAFQAAEMALRDAEDFLDGIVTTGAFDIAIDNGLYGQADAEPDYATAAWDNTDSITYSAAVAINNISTLPRYFIQIISVVAADPGSGGGEIFGVGGPTAGTNTTYFRITARATGISNDSQVVLRSNYARIVD